MNNKEFRDQAALMAMQEILPNKYAPDAFDIADAMVSKRERRAVKDSLTVEALAALDRIDKGHSTKADIVIIRRALDRDSKERQKDDWIKWNGGECPVDDDTIVDIELRDGNIITCRAGSIVWSHFDFISRRDVVDYRSIVNYRVVEEEWRPIKDAPKEHTLWLWDGDEMFVGHYTTDPFMNELGWYTTDCNFDSAGYCYVPKSPTHWMHLPKPPQGKANEK